MGTPSVGMFSSCRHRHRLRAQTGPNGSVHCHLAPGRIGVLVPLLLSVDSRRSQRLLCQRLVAPVAPALALVSALRFPLVLVTPVKLPLTYIPQTSIYPALKQYKSIKEWSKEGTYFLDNKTSINLDKQKLCCC